MSSVLEKKIDAFINAPPTGIDVDIQKRSSIVAANCFALLEMQPARAATHPFTYADDADQLSDSVCVLTSRCIFSSCRVPTHLWQQLSACKATADNVVGCIAIWMCLLY